MPPRIKTIFTLISLGLVACSRTGLLIPAAEEALEPPPPLPCVEIPLDGSGAIVDLATDASLKRADVLLLMDNTSSMSDEIDEIRRELRETIAPLIFQTIADTEFGVAVFSDFPLPDYGQNNDRPFDLRLVMTSDLAAVQAALDLIRLRRGLDTPESQIEAVYQTATGAGLGDWIEPSLGCPRGGFGAPCFRADAQPVVLLFTDAPMHGGPVSGNEYQGISPPPHSYAELLDVLEESRLRVIGLWSGQDDGSVDDLTTLVEDSGALDEEGEPIIFDIGERGERLGTGVVTTLGQYADAAIFDVDVQPVDPMPEDGVDVLDFVDSIRPVRASPMDNIDGIDAETGTFLRVRAGTTVVYEVTIRADALVASDEPRVYRLRVIFRGDRTTFLGQQEVELVIPSLDGEGCEALPRQ